jgi:HTH-type transcriptional regulator, quorum sensing regulator NprR
MTHTTASRQIQRSPKRDLLGPEVGKRIKAARTKRSMTLAQVGGEELSRSFLSLVESGRSRISLRALAIVAERLDTPIAQFLQDEDATRVCELALDYAEIELERDRPAETIRIIQDGAKTYALDPRAQWLLGRALIDVGDAVRATSVLRGAASLPAGLDKALNAEILYSLGSSLYITDRYDEAAVHFHAGLRMALEEPENPALQARLMIGVGHSLYVLNRPAEAIAHYDRAREIFGSVYDLDKVGAIFSAMSLASRKQGNLDAALKYSKQSVATYRLKRDWKMVARELNNMAMRHMERGELDEASRRAEEAVQRAHDVGAEDIEAYCRATLATVYLQQGRTEQAAQEAVAAESLAAEDAPLPLSDAWVVLAEIAALSQDWSRVNELFRKAMAVLRELDHKSRLADLAVRYSLLLKKSGDIESALDMALEAAKANGGRAYLNS